jgi:hypothetical protein
LKKNKFAFFLLIFSSFLHSLGYVFIIKKIEPFVYFSYLIFWWTFIAALDSLLYLRTKRFTVINAYLPETILVSAAYWGIFEILNVRIQNWFYINIESQVALRYGGYLFAYGTVIPALKLMREALKQIWNWELKIRPIKVRNYPFYAISIGLFTLFLTLLYPDYFFSFVWFSPLLILDGVNYKRMMGSIFGEMERGEYGNILLTSLSGLLCGILWEIWNFWAVAKWVYTVPFFEEWKMFEMPLPGYLGFSSFALETLAFLNFLEGLGKGKRRAIVLTSILVLAISFPLIDRYTVFSFKSHVGDLHFIEDGKIRYLRSKGVLSSYGVDESVLTQEEKNKLKLMHLYGLGLKNLKKLERHGIDSIEKLSRINEKDLSFILGEKNIRRVRFYLRQAKKAIESAKDP